MAYATSNPPAIVASRMGGVSGAGNIFYYNDGDAIADVLATGYFTDGFNLGMRVGDLVMFSDTTNGKTYTLYCSVSDSAGTPEATVTREETFIGAGSIISGSGATVALTAEQSGKTSLFDRAAGIIYTLPTPVVGMLYKFDTTVDLTSNTYAVVTGGAFIVGAVTGGVEAAATGETHFANGSTHVGISSNKTTTGGLIGGYLIFEALTTALWSIKGILSNTATPTSPFTT